MIILTTLLECLLGQMLVPDAVEMGFLSARGKLEHLELPDAEIDRVCMVVYRQWYQRWKRNPLSGMF